MSFLSEWHVALNLYLRALYEKAQAPDESNGVMFVRIVNRVRKSICDRCLYGMRMREADRVGRVVRWKLRKYIYRYACMVVWEMSRCMCGMCMSV